MTGRHYFVERDQDGRYAVRAQGSKHASSLFPTQLEAIQEAERLNAEDHPDVERVRHMGAGPDKWRAA